MSAKNNEFNWTDRVTLQKYFETMMQILTEGNDNRFRELEEKMKLQFEARDKALSLQSEVLNARLDGLNEWRGQNKDERQQYVTHTEYDAKHQLLENKMDAMQKIIWLALGGLIVVDYIIQFVK